MAQQGSPGGAPRAGSRRLSPGGAPPSCRRSGLQGLRPLYLVGVPFVYNSSFVLHLALATLEHGNSAPSLCDSELHLRAIIVIARVFFLFVFRLRAGNDLRDQADLALARLVTIGSWFSDCIGASGSLVVVGS